MFSIYKTEPEPEERTDLGFIGMENQDKFCKKQGLPNFLRMNANDNGCCGYCGQQIFTTEAKVEAANRALITDCPHCHRSFCD